MLRNLPLNFWRRISQVLFLGLFIAIPLLGIIRIDLAHFRLYLFGQQLWLNDFLFIYIFWGMMVPLLLMTYMFFGRAICGWICPQTIISEIANRINFLLTGRRIVSLKKSEHIRAKDKVAATMLMDTKSFLFRFGKSLVGIFTGPLNFIRTYGLSKFIFGLLALLGATLSAFGLAFVLVSYFVPPQVILERVINRELSMSAFLNTFNRDPHMFHGQRLLGKEGSTAFFWIILIGVILTVNILYWRHTWCKVFCPYGMWQSLWRNKHALRVTFNEARRSECVDCDRCRRACFMEVEPRYNIEKQFDCINCGVCVTECTTTLAKKGKKGLLGFAFGWNAIRKEDGTPIRQRPHILFYVLPLIFLFSAGRMIYELAFYQPLAVAISKDGFYKIKDTKHFSEYNHYIITVINKGKDRATYQLSYEGLPPGAAHFEEQVIEVNGGEMKRVTFVIDRLKPSEINSDHSFKVTAAHKYLPRIRKTEEAKYFVPPNMEWQKG